MVETLSVSTRRTLKFPAIRISDEVSPATLLNSLVDLAADILGHRSKFFASNNRNAREAIRQTGVLLVFLEEVRSSAAELPESAVLSLSELHVAFQKLRWVLEDCSREGARVWVLANSGLVADQFRSFSRSVSTAVDVLRTDRIDIDVEVKEHVELAMRQARKLRFDVDSEDERVLGIVDSVLIGFENGVCPERNILELVMDYLGIHSWSNCHKEAKFLDSEIELENRSEAKTGMSILTSLLGFVCYCRCAVFDFVDGGLAPPKPKIGIRSGDFMIGITEDDLRCPISLETMLDPVTIASGQSYDRASISKWFAAGNLTCPNSGEKLQTRDIVPNLAVRGLVQIFRPELSFHRKNRHGKREAFELSFAAKMGMKAVADFLAVGLETGTLIEKNKASYEVRILSKSSVFNRACLVEAGVVAPLLKLLGSKDSSSQENSSAALLNLSKYAETRTVIFESHGLEAIVKVLRSGLSSEAKQHSAGVLFYLASNKDHAVSIGENPETVLGLIDLISNGSDRGKKNAMIAIFGLLAQQENHRRVISAGTVSILVDFLNSFESPEELVTDSLAILSILAGESEGSNEILSHGGLNPVIEILNRSDSRMAKEHCVTLLLGICKNCEKEAASVLAKNASLMGSLYSVLSQGTTRGSKKASALITALHEFHEQRSSGFMAPIVRQERFIRAW